MHVTTLLAILRIVHSALRSECPKIASFPHCASSSTKVLYHANIEPRDANSTDSTLPYSICMRFIDH